MNKKMATEVNKNIEGIYRDIRGLVYENLMLKEQSGMNNTSTEEIRTRLEE